LSTQYVLSTERLILRRFVLDDAPFVIALVNEPGWLEYIGDKGVHTIEDAQRYLEAGPLKMYQQFGFGLYLIERKTDATAIGMCGLIKRDALDDVDIGFALLASVAGQGFAFEAASAVVRLAKSLGLPRLLAITTPTNRSSQKLLGKLGLQFDKEITMGPEAEPLHLFAVELDAQAREKI
jgi:RimJ/RimL family protein N-acetyltransferase